MIGAQRPSDLSGQPRANGRAHDLARPAVVLARVDEHWLILLVLVGLALAPLTYPGFVQAWRGFAPVYIVQDLLAGHPLGFWGVAWPPRAAAEGPLPYLLSALWMGLGASPVAAVRWTWGVGLLLGGLGAHAWLRERWGRMPALLGAVAYLYVPYHLNALYSRGAVGEPLALGVLPWLAWAAHREGRGRFLALLVGLAAVACSAPALAALVACPLAVLVALQGRGQGRWPAWAALAMGVLSGIGGIAALGRAGETLPLYLLLAVGDPRRNPWSLGLVPLAALAGGVAAWGALGDGVRRREVALWGGTFLLGALTASLWPGGSAPFWTPLSLTALAVPPLVAATAAAWPSLARQEVAAGALALMVLAAHPTLTPAFTRFSPGSAPAAVWEEPGGSRLALVHQQVRTDETGQMHLDLTWQAWGPLRRDYTLFVHVVDEEGRILVQEDAPPANGEHPTSEWLPGQVVTEVRSLALPENPKALPLRLALGWYLPQTGERLPLVRAVLPAEADHRVFLHVP